MDKNTQDRGQSFDRVESRIELLEKQLMEKEKLSRAEFEAIFEQEAQMTGTAPEVSGEI